MSAGHPVDDGGETTLPRSNGRMIRPFPLSYVRTLPQGTVDHRRVSFFFKRAIDIALSVTALLVTAPLIALLMIIIRLDSPGAVLFRQIRIGRGGVPFQLFKLRTMFVGQGAQATRVGQFLRPMGLDELPQFWNVLRGQMSIVGPRPERPHLVDEYTKAHPGYESRHAIRPGITGWAQVHGHRGRGSIAERLRRDLQYIRTWTPSGDFWIMLLSVVTVLRDTRRELGR